MTINPLVSLIFIWNRKFSETYNYNKKQTLVTHSVCVCVCVCVNDLLAFELGSANRKGKGVPCPPGRLHNKHSRSRENGPYAGFCYRDDDQAV